MVSRESATGGRCHSEPSSTVQINEDHSDMVKFKDGDGLIQIMANTLNDIYQFSGAIYGSNYPRRGALLDQTSSSSGDQHTLKATFFKPHGSLSEDIPWLHDGKSLSDCCSLSRRTNRS